MKIEEYKVGQKVAIYGYIDAIDIESVRSDVEDMINLRINTPAQTINVNPKREVVDVDPYPPKPAVPQFVADWYEKNKFNFEDKIWSLIISINDGMMDSDKFSKWFGDNYDSIQTLINMRQFGYTIKKELYTVSILNNGGIIKLTRINDVMKLVDGKIPSHGKFTREEIESAGFGWVFNCSGAKVVEADV